MLKWLWKGNNNVFGLSQQTRKVERMYLAFKNLKISKKKVKGGQKGKRKVRMIFYEVKMPKDRRFWCNYKLKWKKQHK